MNIPPRAPIAESIPTDVEQMVAYLVNYFRVSAPAARRAVEEYEAPDAIPEAKQHRA